MYYLNSEHHCGSFPLLHRGQNNNSIFQEICNAYAHLCFIFPDWLTTSALQMLFRGLYISKGDLVVVIYDTQTSVV